MGAARKEDELTPAELEARGCRLIVEGQRLLVKAQVKLSLAPLDSYTQDTAPIKRRKYLAITRAGMVPSTKLGKDVLVKRGDLDKYIQKHGLARGARPPEEDADDIIDRLMSGEDGGERR